MRTSAPGSRDWYHGQRRLEHWYRDNSVYFITARCRDRYPAFKSVDARRIFWDRFGYYSQLQKDITGSKLKIQWDLDDDLDLTL